MLIGSLLGMSLYLSPITSVDNYNVQSGFKSTVKLRKNIYVKSTVSNIATYDFSQLQAGDGHPPIKIWIEIDF